MDQNLENYDLLSKINVKITAPVTATKTAQGKRSQKCIQCEYASSCASDLRRHLKIHSGEKSNKCNQCDFASAYAHNLRTFEISQRLNKCTNLNMSLLRQAL